ncbi:MAG: hypothetical protein R2873_26965 [Caldilineaceae bacterium]|nr:hypothetical protein [Caldilineaceae bacterium]
MERIENQTFHNEAVSVDGKQFIACVFDNCTLAYAGGEVPAFHKCQFVDVSLQFSESAVDTLKFLSGLREGVFTQAVDKIIQGVRQVV